MQVVIWEVISESTFSREKTEKGRKSVKAHYQQVITTGSWNLILLEYSREQCRPQGHPAQELGELR